MITHFLKPQTSNITITPHHKASSKIFHISDQANATIGKLPTLTSTAHMETPILSGKKRHKNLLPDRDGPNLLPHRRRLWLLHDKHTGNRRGHYWDGRNQHGIATTPTPHFTCLTGTKTLWGNKDFIWLSRHHHQPGSRQRNLSIWQIPHHDNWKPSTNVTRGTYYGSNWFGTLEWTHSKRKVKCIPLHLYCIQSVLRINWNLTHWQHIQPRIQTTPLITTNCLPNTTHIN